MNWWSFKQSVNSSYAILAFRNLRCEFSVDRAFPSALALTVKGPRAYCRKLRWPWAVEVSDAEDLLQTVEQVDTIADFEIRRDGLIGSNEALLQAAAVTMDPRAHYILEKD